MEKKYNNNEFPQFGYGPDNISLSQQVTPYTVSMNGNPDKCMKTFDGDIRKFTILNKFFDNYFLDYETLFIFQFFRL